MSPPESDRRVDSSIPPLFEVADGRPSLRHYIFLYIINRTSLRHYIFLYIINQRNIFSRTVPSCTLVVRAGGASFVFFSSFYEKALAHEMFYVCLFFTDDIPEIVTISPLERSVIQFHSTIAVRGKK
jgi:hypothetical protein